MMTIILIISLINSSLTIIIIRSNCDKHNIKFRYTPENVLNNNPVKRRRQHLVRQHQEQWCRELKELKLMELKLMHLLHLKHVHQLQEWR